MMRLVVVGIILFSGFPAWGYPPPPKPESPGEEKFPPPPEATAAHWRKSQNNLKQIALAMHNYESVYSHFPANIVDAKGNVLLSWRVAILPYLEEDALFREFKLDEPWDSKTNKPLLAKMPKVFAPVRVKAKAGHTFYQGFEGNDTLFDPENRKQGIAGIPDGTSNTVAVVEAGTAVEWTRPVDLKFDKNKDLPKLGGHFDGDFNIALCDGSVMRAKKTFDAATMKLAVQKSDGQAIDLDKLNK
jgi:hypothetical protein